MTNMSKKNGIWYIWFGRGSTRKGVTLRTKDFSEALYNALNLPNVTWKNVLPMQIIFNGKTGRRIFPATDLYLREVIEKIRQYHKFYFRGKTEKVCVNPRMGSCSGIPMHCLKWSSDICKSRGYLDPIPVTRCAIPLRVIK